MQTFLREKYHKNIDPRRAEFATCSLGIGLGYLQKHWEDILEDFCIHFGGKRYSIPRYFRKKIEEIQPGWIFDFKQHMNEYAKEQMVGLFDKASNSFQENDMFYDYDWFVQDLWKEYVSHKAETIKKKESYLKKLRRFNNYDKRRRR